MSKKIVHEIPDEELFKLASGSDEPVVMDKLTEAAKFIYAHNIKHGSEKIPAQVIYFTYREWKGWDSKRQAKAYFFRDFSKFFTSVRTTDGICYLLDPKPFDLSADAYWLIRKQLRDDKSKKTTKKTR